MAVDLTTALTEVRSLIDEPIAQFWQNSELTSWLNQGCEQAQRETEWAQSTGTIATTAGTQAYIAPSDLLRVHRLEFVPQNNSAYTYSLDFRGYNEMDAAWGNLKTLPAAYPELFTLWMNPDNSDPTVKGLNILLYPVPSVDGVLTVYYPRTIVPAASGSDDIDILLGWEMMIYDFAAWRALKKDADPRAKEFEQDFLTNIDKLKTVSRTYSDQANYFSTGAQNYNPLFLDLDD